MHFRPHKGRSCFGQLCARPGINLYPLVLAHMAREEWRDLSTFSKLQKTLQTFKHWDHLWSDKPEEGDCKLWESLSSLAANHWLHFFPRNRGSLYIPCVTLPTPFSCTSYKFGGRHLLPPNSIKNTWYGCVLLILSLKSPLLNEIWNINFSLKHDDGAPRAC